MSKALCFEDEGLAQHFFKEWKDVRNQMQQVEKLLAKAGGDFGELYRMRESGEAILSLTEAVRSFDKMVADLGVTGEKAEEARKKFLNALSELAEADEASRKEMVSKRIKEILLSLIMQ